MMRSIVVVGLIAAGLALPSGASADNKKDCLAASSEGQNLRDTNQLVAARNQFRLCAAQSCPAVVQRDCATWLDDTEKAIPTVVLSATDATGATRTDVQITVDGQPFAAALDGRSLPIDPGSHMFHFVFPGGSTVDKKVLVSQGQKDQPILGALPVATPLSQVLPQNASSAGSGDHGVPWKTLGLVIGGVGVAGVLVGTIFGVVAVGDKSSADCTGTVCDAGPLNSAKSAATISDIGFIGGGVLVAAGASILLFAPAGTHGGASGVRVAPTTLAHGGGLLMGGTF